MKVVAGDALRLLKKKGKDGQVCAKCIGLAQIEQLLIVNVLVALMGRLTLRVSSLLVSASIFKFISASPLSS
jgi:hypothetical protein